MSEPVQPIEANGSVQTLIDLVREIAQSLVDDSAGVVVDAVPDGDGTLLRLRVAPGEVGKVIGKQGRTARSLRTILGAAGMKLKHRFALDIIEEAREHRQSNPETNAQISASTGSSASSLASSPDEV